MIKAIIFDMDGVLIDADKWHFNALNVALQHTDVDPISWQEHLTIYKGIPTKKKLEILAERKGLPQDLWSKINRSKQDVTLNIVDTFCVPDAEKIEMLKLLKRKYRVVVCSNAIRQTVDLMLKRSGLEKYVDFSLSNEDVVHSKPSPEIYKKAFEMLNLRADECVIIEDSDVGKRAAIASGAMLCSVAGPHEVNYYRVMATVLQAEKLRVVIPAAGQGKRFSEMGYVHPKPLIDVGGQPMIKCVLDNFSNVGDPVVVMQQKHVEQYCAEPILKRLNASVDVISCDGLTEGAACTVLLAREHINNSGELIIANSDQFVDYNIQTFVQQMRDRNADGGILTFQDSSPKWSFARVDEDGRVLEVAEKIAISNHATVGIYYYRQGRDFVSAAEQMIAKNIRVNNEFYVCPVFNEMIAAGKNIYIHEIDVSLMHGLGTPEDLQRFLKRGSETVIIELDESVEEISPTAGPKSAWT